MESAEDSRSAAEWIREIESQPWHEQARILRPGGELEGLESDPKTRAAVLQHFATRRDGHPSDGPLKGKRAPPPFELFEECVGDRFLIEEWPETAGSFGWVLRATDRQSGNACAVKVIPLASPGDHDQFDDELRRQFDDELRRHHGIWPGGVVRQHAGLLPIIGSGVWSLDQREFGWFASPWLDGAKAITDDGIRSRTVAARFRLFEQACEALGELHRAGLVHRDLKPNNILVSGEGDAERAYLVDLGMVAAAKDFVAGIPPYYSEDAMRKFLISTDIAAMARIYCELFQGTKSSTLPLLEMARQVIHGSLGFTTCADLIRAFRIKARDSKIGLHGNVGEIA